MQYSFSLLHQTQDPAQDVLRLYSDEECGRTTENGIACSVEICVRLLGRRTVQESRCRYIYSGEEVKDEERERGQVI